jgi:tetratricopeptide (TPR) repeat protein
LPGGTWTGPGGERSGRRRVADDIDYGGGYETMSARTRIVLILFALVLCSFLFGGFCLESPSAMMVGIADGQASRGEYDEAIKSFNKAIEMSPDSWYVLEHRGKFYLKIERFDAAAADLTRVIELNPGLLGIHEIYTGRADAYLHLGRLDEAIADYSRAIEIRRNDVPALYGRALAHEAAGRRDNALADLGRACGLGYEPACEKYDDLAGYPHR